MLGGLHILQFKTYNCSLEGNGKLFCIFQSIFRMNTHKSRLNTKHMNEPTDVLQIAQHNSSIEHLHNVTDSFTNYN